MELKSIFQMTKTDRYTQDGRDELAKLQETEDVKYKTGDISQKTGLQKQPDGSWAPPKKGAGNKSAAGGEKPTEKHPPKVMPKGMHPAEFMKAWEDDAKKNGYKKGQGNEWRDHLRNEENNSAEEKKPSIPTDKEVSNSLDELSNSKEMASKVIGGVKVTYNPENGFYKVTHKAPGGQEVSRGCSDILEAQQAVMFRLDRIKKGEIPAISESAENKPAKTSWKDAQVSLTNPAKVPLSLNFTTFGMTPAWAKKHGYSPSDVNGTAAQVKLAKEIITSQDWSDPENAVKKINDLDFGYNNWRVTEKQEDRVKIAQRDSMGNLHEMTIKRPQAASDAAPRILTGDTRIRVKK
jgi:hypothetical protein